MKKIKKELWYCNDITNRSCEMEEDVRYVEEDKWKKQMEKNKIKDKNKVR